MISIDYFFILSGLLFFIGVFGFITRRNLVAMLISVELVLNAVDLNFAAFNRLLFPAGQEGMIFTLFHRRLGSGECGGPGYYHQCLPSFPQRPGEQY